MIFSYYFEFRKLTPPAAAVVEVVVFG